MGHGVAFDGSVLWSSPFFAGCERQPEHSELLNGLPRQRDGAVPPCQAVRKGSPKSS